MPFRRKDSKNWYITVGGVQRSAGTADREAAEALEHKLNHEVWLGERMGLKPPKAWQDAVVQREKEAKGKKSWADEQRMLRWWDQHLGHIKDLNLITRDMIDVAIQKHRNVTLEGATPENTTANKYVRVVSCILNSAEREWQWGNRAPVLRTYREPPPRDVCPTPEQVLRLIAELPGHSADMALYAVATMHRRGNVTGLEWSMVDWEQRAVKVAGMFTKTGKPIYVPLNNTAMGVLEARRKTVVRHPRYVFHYQGQPVFHVTTKAWRAAVKRAGITENVTLHTMRHCGNSWLAQRGVPREIRARLGGWSLGSQAIDGYTHLYIDHLRPYAAMLDEVMSGARRAKEKAA